MTNIVGNNVFVLLLHREPNLPSKSIWFRESSVICHWLAAQNNFILRRRIRIFKGSGVRDGERNLKLKSTITTESSVPSFPFLAVQLPATGFHFLIYSPLECCFPPLLPHLQLCGALNSNGLNSALGHLQIFPEAIKMAVILMFPLAGVRLCSSLQRIYTVFRILVMKQPYQGETWRCGVFCTKNEVLPHLLLWL